MTMENKYDDPVFFEKYSQMDRSREGLPGAGEWQTLRSILPDFAGKRVLDLGCGYGWHCIYAAEHGARSVLGLDLSEKMLEVARRKTSQPQVEYRRGSMEEAEFPSGSFQVVLSSLALHYVEDYRPWCAKCGSGCRPAETLCLPASTRCSPPRAPRTGSTARTGTSGISRWTGIFWKGSGTPAFWGNTW